ncbi:uncharacterized protein UHOD_05019 [Ustilago sp. UG-2017b]|nr:uncharacterized protein UHOD_05019 [Ustilago sp. UG-2017b]
MTNKQEYIDVSTIGLDAIPPTPSPLPSASDKATVSYWLATTPAHLLPESLDAPPSQSDVVIIGSGITGVSCALHLINSLPSSSSSLEKTEGGVRTITIVEARQFCSGATGRNGGHLTAASALAYTDIAANPDHLLGQACVNFAVAQRKDAIGKAVQEMLQFEEDTANAIRRLIAQEAVEKDVGFTDEKNWHLCFTQEEVEAFEDSLAQAGEHERMKKFVDKVRRVGKEEVDSRMNHPHGVVGVFEIPGATLHPRALVAVIYRRAERLAKQKGINLNLVTECPVHSVAPTTDGSKLTTSNGAIDAGYVVHATNGYASHLLPSLSTPTTGITPTRAQVIALPPSSPSYLWGMGLSAGDGYEYGHQRPSSEPPLYILGGGREYAPSREWGVADDTTLNSDVSEFLHPCMGKVFPNSYGGKEVEREWTGIMGYTKTKNPIVGTIGGSRGREWIAAGYSGHGMTRAYGCAEVVAEMVMAEIDGRQWREKGGFPGCYLTPGARAEGVEEKGELVADGMKEKDEGMKEKDEGREKGSSEGRSSGCCVVS